MLSDISAQNDFDNLQKLDSGIKNEKLDQSLNLGSAYSKNDYQFDSKVSSVQRDLSLENSTNGYNSILNSSDVSNTENNDKMETLRKGNNHKGLSQIKSKSILHSSSSKSMMRIKSSAKLFTIDKNTLPDNEEEKELGGGLVLAENFSKQSYDSENISELSTGDSAYPIVAFQNRCVKEFEPKITMKAINENQATLINYISKVPMHTKLKYQSPMQTKQVSSPPQQISTSDISDSISPQNINMNEK